MNVEEQAADTRKELLEAETTVLRALASARSLVSAQEEEIKKARAEAAERNDDFLTEEQFAEILQVSAVTIAGLRKRGVIEPIWVASLPRYSRTHHVAQAVEIFKKKAPRPRGPKSR